MPIQFEGCLIEKRCSHLWKCIVNFSHSIRFWDLIFFYLELVKSYCAAVWKTTVYTEKKKTYLWHCFSERHLSYIFKNGRISALQDNLQTKFNLDIWWLFRLSKYIKALWMNRMFFANGKIANSNKVLTMLTQKSVFC